MSTIKESAGDRQDVHLALDKVETSVNVLLRLRLVLLDKHGPDELVHRIFRRQRREFLYSAKIPTSDQTKENAKHEEQSGAHLLDELVLGQLRVELLTSINRDSEVVLSFLKFGRRCLETLL